MYVSGCLVMNMRGNILEGCRHEPLWTIASGVTHLIC